MTRDPSAPHAGRSAELQALLEEAVHAHPQTSEQPTNTAGRAATTSEAPSQTDGPTGPIGGEPRLQVGPGPTDRRPAADIRGRPSLAGVSRSIRLAAQRSAEQHSWPSAPAAAPVRPGHSSRQLPVSRRTGISIGAAHWRATTSRAFRYRPIDGATGPAPLAPEPRTHPAPPASARGIPAISTASRSGLPDGRPQRTRQRAFVLAAGIAAAVVAVVAIAVGGRLATTPTSDGSQPSRTILTTVGTVGTSSVGAPTRIEVAGTSRFGAGPDGGAGTTVDRTGSTRSVSNQTAETPTPETQPPPTAGAGGTATVVTGVSKLTGWVLLGTTGSR